MLRNSKAMNIIADSVRNSDNLIDEANKSDDKLKCLYMNARSMQGAL